VVPRLRAVSVELRHLRLRRRGGGAELHARGGAPEQALSAQVRQLEERVGKQLLVRTHAQGRAHAPAAGAARSRPAAARRTRPRGGRRQGGGRGAAQLTGGFVVPADHEPLRPALTLFKRAPARCRRPGALRRGDRPHWRAEGRPRRRGRRGGAFDRTGLETTHLWTDPRGVRWPSIIRWPKRTS
jgi:hypothetical protein